MMVQEGKLCSSALADDSFPASIFSVYLTFIFRASAIGMLYTVK